MFLQERICGACDVPNVAPVTRRVKKGSSTDSGTDSSSTPKKPPPQGVVNVRGKLWWRASTFSWHVNCSQPKKGMFIPSETEFKVDPSLKGDDFRSERVRTYAAAATAWNQIDCSKRPRLVDKYDVEYGMD